MPPAQPPGSTPSHNDTPMDYRYPRLPATYMPPADRLAALELDVRALKEWMKENQARMKRLYRCLKIMGGATWAVLAPFLAQWLVGVLKH